MFRLGCIFRAMREVVSNILQTISHKHPLSQVARIEMPVSFVTKILMLWWAVSCASDWKLPANIRGEGIASTGEDRDLPGEVSKNTFCLNKILFYHGFISIYYIEYLNVHIMYIVKLQYGVQYVVSE